MQTMHIHAFNLRTQMQRQGDTLHLEGQKTRKPTDGARAWRSVQSLDGVGCSSGPVSLNARVCERRMNRVSNG